MILGHKLLGTGPIRVLLIHDWFSDCSSFKPALPYLNTEKFSYAFVDLRGYGLSKSLSGEYTLNEAASDILNLADQLKWDEFHIVGHSMGGMIAQYLALHHQKRIKSVSAVTPVPACGSKIPQEAIPFLQEAASSNDAYAKTVVSAMTGKRYLGKFIDWKAKKWHSLSHVEARLAYLKMFNETDFSAKAQGLKTPFLVIVGARDAEGHSENVMRETFLKWYPNSSLCIFADSGHYPMQEMPVCFAETIEHFLSTGKLQQ